MGKAFPNEMRRRLESAVSKTVQVEPEGKDNQGAGVVISWDGIILSAAHVTAAARTSVVRRCRLKRNGWDVFCRGRYICDVVYEDANLDIAVLKMRDPPKDLSWAALGDSDQVGADFPTLRIGRDDDDPIATGWVVRIDHERGTPELKIGMPAAPGASGGPIFDAKGRLIGIALKCHAEKREPAACYALPINVIKERILETELVKRLLGKT